MINITVVSLGDVEILVDQRGSDVESALDIPFK